MSKPDILIFDHGTIVVITPTNDDAETYLLGIVPDDVQRWGRSFVCEPRFVGPILQDLNDEGFALKNGFEI